MTTTVHPRPGGRSSRVRSAVYTAVGELMGEGRDTLTFPVIAERAGVNPTTLYRRWGEVATLLEEVSVAALTREGDEVPDTGTLAGDLREWAQVVAADISRPERTRYLRAMVSARTEETPSCPVNDCRREQAAHLVERARSRGEKVPTVDQVLDHLVAPLYYRVVFGLELGEDRPARLARDVMAMAG